MRAIGHRRDGSRVTLDVVDAPEFWMIRDVPEMPRLFDPSMGYGELRCREIPLKRVTIRYGDDWQGPLESSWEFRDVDWRWARALYREELRGMGYLDSDEISRRLNLRYPDDDYLAKLVVVACLIQLLHALMGRDIGRVYPITTFIGMVNGRPRGREEIHYVEDGASRFSAW